MRDELFRQSRLTYAGFALEKYQVPTISSLGTAADKAAIDFFQCGPFKGTLDQRVDCLRRLYVRLVGR